MADFLPPEALAFLDAISGPESRGLYNIRYGGAQFDGYDDHPRTHKTIKSGPNKGKTSSAAGRYQITETTWDNVIQPALNLPDFSPESQDIAAWYLAQQDYRRKAGKDLLGTLRSGDPDAIGNAAKKLSGTWTSLPGGIEQGTNTRRFLNAYNEAFQNRNVAPTPATRNGSALQAIESAFAPSLQAGAASAYAPSGAPLQAPPPARALPSLPQGSAVPLPPRNALPAPPAGRVAAIPPVSATPLPPRTAMPAPPPATGTAPRATLPAISPIAPTIQAREPWSPLQEMAVLNPPRVTPPRPPSSTFDLGMQLPAYAENYVPTSQRVAATQPSLTTRTVRTLPIDPTTGSVVQPSTNNLQASLDQIASTRGRQTRADALSVAATSDPVVDPLARQRNRAFLDNLNATRPPTPPLPPVTIPVAQVPRTNALPGPVNTATAPAIPTIRANDPAMQPRSRVNNAGTNYAAAIPAPTIRAWEDPVQSADPRGTNAFNYPGDQLRLTPQPTIRPPSPPLPPAPPGALRVGAHNSALGAPSVASFNWGRRMVPPEQQTNPTAQEVVAGIANGTIPYTSAMPRTRGVVSTANSPGAQSLGKMNMGQNPVGKFLMSLFLPREQVSTARSVRPLGQGNSARDGLSAPQIDIAQRQSNGDSSYQSLIEWAMRN
jgi:muramidase (phage lysozyme)